MALTESGDHYPCPPDPLRVTRHASMARFGFGDRLCRAEAQAGPCVCSTLCAVSCLSGLVRVLLKQNMRHATRIRKHNCFALTHTNVFALTHTRHTTSVLSLRGRRRMCYAVNLLRLLVASTLTSIQRRRRESRVRVATQKTPLDAYKAHAERCQWLRPFPTTMLSDAERGDCYGR